MHVAGTTPTALLLGSTAGESHAALEHQRSLAIIAGSSVVSMGPFQNTVDIAGPEIRERRPKGSSSGSPSGSPMGSAQHSGGPSTSRSKSLRCPARAGIAARGRQRYRPVTFNCVPRMYKTLAALSFDEQLVADARVPMRSMSGPRHDVRASTPGSASKTAVSWAPDSAVSNAGAG